MKTAKQGPLELKREVLRRQTYQPPTMVNLGRTVDLIQGTECGGAPDAVNGERAAP